MFARENAAQHLAAPVAVRFSIFNARLFYKQREFADAILNYIAVLKSQSSENKKKYLQEFLDTLRAYLAHEPNDTNICDVLHISTIIYGTEFLFWRLIAEYYFTQGKLLKSLEIFDKAKSFAKNDIEWLQASTSYENVKTNLFDAWHWRMINDAKRNRQFGLAITAALNENPASRVLDIGCGSGIFSVIASRNSKKTYACERCEVMCSIARKCFEQNKSDVSLCETHSKELKLDEHCNLLITETVDSAIFGERIVDTILDAKERLLEQNAIIIPNKAIAVFSLIESDFISKENAFEHCDTVAIISNCCYLSELNGKRIIPPSPYTCSHLKELHHGYRRLSTPVEGLAVDFNNIQQLRQIKNDRFLTEVILNVTDKGIASAITVWFKLNLFEDYEICTKPEEGHSWQQAVFPFYPPFEVQPDDKIRLEVFIKDNALFVQPFGLPSSNREILRAPAWKNLLTMNDSAIREFYLNFVKNTTIAYSQVLDCTELLLNHQFSIASGQSAIRYIEKDAMSLEKAKCKQKGVILFWPFSCHGNLMDDYLTSIVELHIRSPNTIMMPYKIGLKGCLITSNELSKRGRLIDEPNAINHTYCGVNLSSMDAYRVQHFHEIETRSLDFCQLSDDIQMIEMIFEKDATSNLAQLTMIKKECVFTCTQEALCHAILYWFDISDQAGNSLDLRRQTNSYLSSAFMLHQPRQLKSGDLLKAQFSILHGNVIFHWVKEVLFL